MPSEIDSVGLAGLLGVSLLVLKAGARLDALGAAAAIVLTAMTVAQTRTQSDVGEIRV